MNNIPTTIKNVDLLCDCEFGLYVIVYEYVLPSSFEFLFHKKKDESSTEVDRFHQ